MSDRPFKEVCVPAMEFKFSYTDAESKPENGGIVAARLIRERCPGKNDSAAPSWPSNGRVPSGSTPSG
jgi:hypothetical protein